MLHHLLLPFLAGLLVGVNPFVAPSLHARLHERAGDRRAFHLEMLLIVLLVATLAALVTWRFSAFISARLTNSLLVLGLFALAAAFYTYRPIQRRRDPDAPPTARRWLTRYAGDAFYYAGPAWILAIAAAMQQLTLGHYLLPFAAATLGCIASITLWTTRWHAALPHALPTPGEPRTRAQKGLSLAYGASAVLMLAANMKLI